MTYQASNQSTIKSRNKRLIFDVLLNNTNMTRASLSTFTGVSKPAVSKNVDELILEGFIVESGKDSATSLGKKGTILDINKEILKLLAIDISKNKVSFLVSDIFGDFSYRKEISLENKKDIDGFLEVVERDISSLDINLVSISFAGVVRDDEISHAKKDLKDLYFKRILPMLSFVDKRAIIIRNDLNNSILAEREYGACKRDKNAVLISCDNGVGAGIIINEMIYEGDRFAAGEIGYISSNPQKDDEYRFLEDRLSIRAIEKRYTKKKGKSQSYDDFKSDLKKSKKKAIALYDTIIKELASTIVTVLSVLDINKCVLTGSLFDLTNDFIADLQKEVNTVSPFDIALIKSEVKDSSLRGAVLTGIEEFYNKLEF